MSQLGKIVFVLLYLTALVISNLVVKHYGAPGLYFASSVLIPFDFICRCIFHETWKGKQLVINLLILTVVSGIITIAINIEAVNIATASFFGIIAVQISAGITYQILKKTKYLYKVNISDIVAVIFDSLTFQLIAFSVINWQVTSLQMLIKIIGGLIWYIIIFKIIKIKL